MSKPRFADFGRCLRDLLTKHAQFGAGFYRWFQDEVGLEDRYVRRWMRGDNLPSDDNWRRFTTALRQRVGTDPALEQQLRVLDLSLRRLRARTLTQRPHNAAIGDGQSHTESGQVPAFAQGHTPEASDYLDTRWAALRAAALARDELFHPAFFDILRQLTATEVKLLDAMYDKALRSQVESVLDPNYWSVEEAIIGSISVLFELFNDAYLTTRSWSQEQMRKFVFRGAPEGCESDYRRFSGCLENLLRIGLVRQISPESQAAGDRTYNEILETMTRATGRPLPAHITPRQPKDYETIYRLTSTGSRFVRSTRYIGT